MHIPSLLRQGSFLLVVGLAACADATPVAPVRPPAASSLAMAPAAASNERVMVSARLGEMNAALAAIQSKVRVAKVELLMSGKWNGLTSTIIFANDRVRGIGTEWVEGDPNRGGRTGVTYQLASHLGVRPFVINPDRVSFRQATLAELETQLEEGMSAWRDQTCSTAPIARVPIPSMTDPNFVDNFFLLLPPSPNYVQTADIVQGGWQPPQFFRNIAVFFGEPPASGDAILGITFTFSFADDNGELTDIDRNRKADTGLAEIYYNALYAWDNSGLFDFRVIDFFSTVAHEAGHALGLSHLGKVFVTRRDAADGLTPDEVKYAPYALMNALYIAGRNDIVGVDRSAFCEIWASR